MKLIYPTKILLQWFIKMIQNFSINFNGNDNRG